MKNQKLKVWSLKCELIGLVLLFVGAFWQAKFSGWWDQQLPEWQSYIQEEVNLAVLTSLQDVAALGMTNSDQKQYLFQKIKENTNRAYNFSITERDKRKAAMNTGQAATFWTIRDILMIVGALLLVVGKWLDLQAAKSPAYKVHN